MKVGGINDRRRLLHSIYSTIDSTFETPKNKYDKNTIKTDHFIAKLKQVTSKFNSKQFLKKPLQEMLKEFWDPDLHPEEPDSAKQKYSIIYYISETQICTLSGHRNDLV